MWRMEARAGSHLEQAVFVGVLAQPHSTAGRELRLRRVDQPLVNPGTKTNTHTHRERTVKLEAAEI